MKKAHGHFNIVLRPEPEGGFTAIVPALPGCVTFGRTLAEAKKMAKDAITGYIESLKKHKEPIPTDNETLVASLDLAYAAASRRYTARDHQILGTKRFRSRPCVGSHFVCCHTISRRRAVVPLHN